MLRAGNETVRLQVGELWWFDNKQVHEAWNDGPNNRVHLIFDLLPHTTAKQIKRYTRIRGASPPSSRLGILPAGNS